MTNREEMRELIRETVQETVKTTLTEIGMDTRDPIQLQRDMSFLRDLRRARDSASAKALAVGVGILVTAALGALVLGVRDWLHSNS
jgi:hypothetical protein